MQYYVYDDNFKKEVIVRFRSSSRMSEAIERMIPLIKQDERGVPRSQYRNMVII